MLKTLYRDLRWYVAYALNDLSGTAAECAEWLERHGLQPEATILIQDVTEPLFKLSCRIFPEVR